MDFYAILGISKDADEATVRSAYKMLARKYHPDTGVGSSTEKFRQVSEAYETLGNSRRRRSYDLSRSKAQRLVRPRAEPMSMRRPEQMYDDVRNVFDSRQPTQYDFVPQASYGLNDLFEELSRLVDEEFFPDLYWR